MSEFEEINELLNNGATTETNEDLNGKYIQITGTKQVQKKIYLAELLAKKEALEELMSRLSTEMTTINDLITAMGGEAGESGSNGMDDQNMEGNIYWDSFEDWADDWTLSNWSKGQVDGVGGGDIFKETTEVYDSSASVKFRNDMDGNSAYISTSFAIQNTEGNFWISFYAKDSPSPIGGFGIYILDGEEQYIYNFTNETWDLFDGNITQDNLQEFNITDTWEKYTTNPINPNGLSTFVLYVYAKKGNPDGEGYLDYLMITQA